MLFRKIFPKKLFTRSFLIVFLPIVFLQLFVGTVFIQRHFSDVTQQMTHSVALEVKYAIATVTLADDKNEAFDAISDFAHRLDLNVTFTNPRVYLKKNLRGYYDLSGKVVIETLEHELLEDVKIDLLSNKDLVSIYLDTRHGQMRVDYSRDRVSAQNPHQLLVLMVAAALILLLIATLFLRNQISPIIELTKAAEAFGKGQPLAFKPSGAEEIRRAGSAFLAMRARIERQIEQRTHMLSGVSHDLRTPLTRMKLTLALEDESEGKGELLRDVNDMEKMIDSFLTFARDNASEKAREVDLVEFYDKIIMDAKRLSLNVEEHKNIDTKEIKAMLKYGIFTRAIDNLISNAGRYGDKIRISLHLTDQMIAIHIEDNGPGIPEMQRSEALKPFVRLDEARNQDKGGGSGLGLTIAADSARQHGGRLSLDKSDMGGLKASYIIPR